jgi:hypothetical protein
MGYGGSDNLESFHGDTERIESLIRSRGSVGVLWKPTWPLCVEEGYYYSRRVEKGSNGSAGISTLAHEDSLRLLDRSVGRVDSMQADGDDRAVKST